MRDTDFADLGGEYLDWENPEIGFANFSPAQTNDLYLSPGSLSLVRHSRSSIDEIVRLQKGLSFPNSSIPTAPSPAVRSLIQRPKLQSGAQRIANLILHTLKSYPLMMLRHNTLPPFIHSRLISPDINDVRMEPLTNCISLVHMISSEVRGSRKLFWKNVQQECERWSKEVRLVCCGFRRSVTRG